MKLFENINREYTPGINLDVLDKTYNTLEVGHQKAIEASSALKTEIAKLDMNEAEDGFKQQLVNEIQNTIEANTIYGNSYGALDDLVLASGNIMSDPRVIGRLKTQQEYLAFKDKVDKMQIPEGMKDMYKEENPYTYKDKIDANTGKIIGAETWKPNSMPVNTIAQSVIQKHALDIASKQTGSFDTISFLDANGNPTTDPLKSKDGNIYKQVGTRFEKLPADKIAEAYRLAIQSIPGAEESLRQDYKYANYSYNKERNNEQIPLYNGLTDQYGRVYSYNQWLERKINKFSRLSAVNNVHTDTTFGTALSQSIANPGYSNPYITNGKGGINKFGIDSNIPVAKAGTKEVVSNSYTSAIKDKALANTMGLDIVKRYTTDFKDADSISDLIKELKVSGPGNAANKIIQQYGKDMSLEERFNLIKSFKSYYYNNKCISDIEKAHGVDIDALRFTSEIASGDFTDNNRYSKEINEFLNNHFEYNDFAEWHVGKDVMSELCKLYGKDVTINTLKDKGIEITDNGDDTYDVKIGPDERNLIPEFASNLRKADSMVPGSLWGFLKDAFGSVHSSNYDEKGLDINMKNPFSKDYWTRNTNRNFIADRVKRLVPFAITPISELNTSFDELVRIYDDAKEQAAKAESKAGINKGVIDYNIYPNTTAAELYYNQFRNYLGLTPDIEKKLKEEARTKVRNAFANANINAGHLELVDESNHAIKIDNDKDLRYAIQAACLDENNDVNISVIEPTETTLNSPIGYRLSFIMPEGYSYGDYEAGKVININSYGVINEGIEFNPSSNPTLIAENILMTAKANNDPKIEVLGNVPGFRDTSLYPGKNGYTSAADGIVYTEPEAKLYIDLMINIAIFKDLYRSKHFDYTNPNVVENFENSYDEYVNLLCKLNGKSYNYNNSQLTNYLKADE